MLGFIRPKLTKTKHQSLYSSLDCKKGRALFLPFLSWLDVHMPAVSVHAEVSVRHFQFGKMSGRKARWTCDSSKVLIRRFVAREKEFLSFH